MLQSLRKNKVVKNAGWIIGGKVANKLLAFVVGIFAARYLGPSNYGLINYAAAYATFFASLCTLGINSVIVKNFVDHPDQQGETIGTTLLLRAISSLLSALAIIGIVSVLIVHFLLRLLRVGAFTLLWNFRVRRFIVGGSGRLVVGRLSVCGGFLTHGRLVAHDRFFQRSGAAAVRPIRRPHLRR